VCHAGWPPHQRIGHIALKNIDHTPAAGHLMSEDGGGTLVRGASHFARPHGNAVTHATCRKLQPQVSPVGIKCWLVEPLLTVHLLEHSFPRVTHFEPKHFVSVYRSVRPNERARDPALNFSNAIDGRYAHRRSFLN
jgi:hypothetical protein